MVSRTTIVHSEARILSRWASTVISSSLLNRQKWFTLSESRVRRELTVRCSLVANVFDLFSIEDVDWRFYSALQDLFSLHAKNECRSLPCVEGIGVFCFVRVNISVRALSVPMIDFSNWFFTALIDDFFVDEHVEIAARTEACPPGPNRCDRLICFFPLYSKLAIARSSNWIKLCSWSRFMWFHHWRRTEASLFFNNQRKQINKSREISSLKLFNEERRFWNRSMNIPVLRKSERNKGLPMFHRDPCWSIHRCDWSIDRRWVWLTRADSIVRTRHFPDRRVGSNEWKWSRVKVNTIERDVFDCISHRWPSSAGRNHEQWEDFSTDWSLDYATTAN